MPKSGREDASARGAAPSDASGDTTLIRSAEGDFFKCYSCGRRYAWRRDIAGQTFRCACEAKVKVPSPQDDTLTAAESLDDTVADVELDQHFDDIGDEAGPDEEEHATDFRRIPQRGVFGWPMAVDVLFWSVMSLAGVSCGIMAAFLWKYWWQWIAAFLILGPYSFYRLYRSWPRWTQGRPWIDCLLQSLGAEEEPEEEEEKASAAKAR